MAHRIPSLGVFVQFRKGVSCPTTNEPEEEVGFQGEKSMIVNLSTDQIRTVDQMRTLV